jgi:integrase
VPDRIRVWVSQLKDRPHLSLQWYDAFGRKRTQSAGTASRKEADGKRGDLEADLNNDRYRESTGISWDRFREVYTDERLGGLRQRTGETAGTVFDVFEQECRPSLLRQVDERKLSRFVAGMRKRRAQSGATGLAPMTQRNYLVCLKTALKWACEQKMIPRVPAFPKIRVPKKRPQPVQQADFDKLLAVMTSPEWRAYLLCGWWAGLRLTEAKHLQWSASNELPHVDLEKNRITLPAVFAKSCEDDWVPLHASLRAALGVLPKDGDDVFPGIRCLSLHAITARIGRKAKRAGVILSMHRLRKGFGCRIAQQLGKGDAPVLHRLMRHKSMQLTMEYYASVDGRWRTG